MRFISYLIHFTGVRIKKRIAVQNTTQSESLNHKKHASKKRTPKDSNNNRFSPTPIKTLETCVLSDNHMHQNNNKTLHLPEFFTDAHNSTISWLNLVSQMGILKDADEKSICAAVLNKFPSKSIQNIQAHQSKAEFITG